MAKHKAAAPKTASKAKNTAKATATKASGIRKLATAKPVARGKAPAKPAAKPKIAAPKAIGKSLNPKQKVETKNKMITKSTAVAREKAAPTVDSSPAKAPAKPVVAKPVSAKVVAGTVKEKVAAPANANAAAPANTNVKPAKAAAPAKVAPKLTVATSDGQPVKPAAKGVAPAAVAVAAVPAAVAPKPVPVKEPEFAEGDYVVYPTHGVGRIQGVVTQEIAGTTLKVIVINFEKERMTLRVPVAKATNSGLRRLSSRKEMETALKTLKGRSRVRRMMWSRRAQEYEAKINSGDPVSIAEVVRDLYRNAGQPDQSYSERQIYQAALDRLARELAAVEKIDEMAAAEKLESVLRAA